MARTWLKIDDTMVENPKFVDLSPFAWTLWIHGVSYCSRNLTDGRIPQAMLPRLTSITDPSRAAAELVDAELWHATEDGYEVHDYLEHQRSRADVEADRAKATERQRRSRDNRAEVTATSHRDTDVTPLAVSVSVSAENSSSSPTTGTTGGDPQPVDNDEKLQQVIDHVIQHRARGATKSAAWKRTVARNLHTDDNGGWWSELQRLCTEYPDAPVSMLAAAAEGEKSPHLTHYRRHQIASA
jgi:hypothetical protein